MATRHRGTFKPEHPAPYELSRGKIEALIKCQACFWLERAKGVKFPGMPGFLLNTNTDTLLKKDFDQYRDVGPHPIMIAAGLEHLRPFAHQDFHKWESSMQFGASPNHFNTLHEQTNILFGGGLDDVWENVETGELHIVDYKSTAQVSKTPKPLDESFLAPPTDPKAPDYKAGYRRQMAMYQWILRRKGYEVSDVGYFLYVDGLHVSENGMIDRVNSNQAWMRFKTAIIPYEADDSWVEEALINAKETLLMQSSPAHSLDCEYQLFLKGVDTATSNLN
jgi:hypothetical protein